MSIGKKSIARAANAAAKAEQTLEEVVTAVPDTETAPAELAADTLPCVCENVDAAAEEAVAEIPERFKNVSVGDAMPAFLL